MANNFAHVEHIADRNAMGVAYIKDRIMSVLGKNSLNGENEEVVGTVTMGALKDLGRKAFGRIPLFRTRIKNNSVETFQEWFNEFAEVNNINKRVHVTGVWSEETQEALDLIVDAK